MSTWRSGSTFLGDILNAISNTYYYYEPLLYYKNHQIRSPSESSGAINTVRQLLSCNYTGLTEYLEFTVKEDKQWFIQRNFRLWENCKNREKLCWDPNFLNPICRSFPFQSMKLVRLRTAHSEQLIIDPALNVKFVLLIRDPRGIMHSRKHLPWCDQPDCIDPAVLCNDLVDDFKSAKMLLDKYPSRFKVIRYEDLSLNPFTVTEEILKFYGLPFDANVQQFLDSHTHGDRGGDYSVFRNSKATAFQWARNSTWYDIEQIQNHCVEALSVWGYKLVNDKDELNSTSFEPLLSFPFTQT